MKILLYFSLFWTISIYSLEPAADEFMRGRMIGDLDIVKNIFQTSYAPAEWKQTYAGWHLEDEINGIKQHIQTSPLISLKEYHRLLRNFFTSARDYHVSVEFFSTEVATLPFRVRHVDDRYFFTYIDHDQIKSDKSFPFAIGDELLAMNGLAMPELMKYIIETEYGNNYDETDLALAEIYLTTRQGCLGHEVPKGPITLTGRKKGTMEEVSHTMDWCYWPEEVSNIFTLQNKKMNRRAKASSNGRGLVKATHSFFQKEMMMAQFESLNAARAADREPTDMMGSKRSFLPPLGEILWEDPKNDHFHGYLFRTPQGRRAGYIRIPTYKPLDTQAWVKEYAGIIDYFEREADVLVIDQMNNPGGLLLYMYSLASMLTDRPLEVPKHRQMISQEDVFFALGEIRAYEALQNDEQARNMLGEFLVGMPVTLTLAKALLNYYRFIISEWNHGRILMDAGLVYGVGPIEPHPQVRFTKPILLLVNSLDFSGGDLFPAILQDNQRATILGTRTAGAGGILGQTEFPSLTGISEINYTISMAERLDHSLIENHGVTPDIVYRPSTVDFENNYVEYVQKIQYTLDILH